MENTLFLNQSDCYQSIQSALNIICYGRLITAESKSNFSNREPTTQERFIKVKNKI